MGQPVHERDNQLAGAAQAASLHHQYQRSLRVTLAEMKRLPHPDSFRAAEDLARAVAQRRDERPRSSLMKMSSFRMSAPAGKEPSTPAAAWPTDTYFDEFHKLPEYFNGEAVIVYHDAGGQHGWRQPRVFPSLRSHQCRQHFLDRELSHSLTWKRAAPFRVSSTA